MLPPTSLPARRLVLRAATATLSLVAWVAASLPPTRPRISYHHHCHTSAAFVPFSSASLSLTGLSALSSSSHPYRRQQHAFSSATSKTRRWAARGEEEGEEEEEWEAPEIAVISLDPGLQAGWPELRPAQWKQLEALANLLQEVNTRINVISRKDIQNVVPNHILPALVNDPPTHPLELLKPPTNTPYFHPRAPIRSTLPPTHPLNPPNTGPRPSAGQSAQRHKDPRHWHGRRLPGPSPSHRLPPTRPSPR